MTEKRSRLDFKDHEFSIVSEGGTHIYSLKKPDTVIDSLMFINTRGILSVTGDYGNWIFCREFHPSAIGYCSAPYWIEKLKISSSQVPGKYDSEETEKEIQEKIAEAREEHAKKIVEASEADVDFLDDEDYTELMGYYEMLLRHVDDEVEYTYMAYRNQPSWMDCESVPFCKKLDYWLLVVFDAFDEMCKRMAIEEPKLTLDVAAK